MSRVPVDWKGLSSIVLWEAGVYRDERGLVHVPYRLPGGAVHNEKLHAAGGRSWWATTGLPLVPFGLELVPEPDRREGRLVWIAEGESDALCLREHYAGWRGRPVDVLGLPGAGTWRPEWRRYVLGYEGLLVFPDADPAGERMAAAVAETLRGCLIVVWLSRGRDVRDVIQGDGPEALDERIVRAEEASLMHRALSECKTVDEVERFLREVTW